jgi:hypothetical protein
LYERLPAASRSRILTTELQAIFVAPQKKDLAGTFKFEEMEIF